MSRTARIGPVTALLAGVAAFAGIYVGVQALRVWLFGHLHLTDNHAVVEARALTSIVLIWTTLGAIVLILRLRGQNLRDIGWGKRASVWGWLLAIVFTVLYCAFTFMGPMLKGAPVLTDWSLFRIGTALTIGVSAGICEETIFRGFVMTQAQNARLHWTIQIVLSAVLFGLAHVGWGGLAGHFDVWPMIASMVATAILGTMLAVTYLAGGRSLMPVIAAHAVTDMVIEPWLLLYMISGGHAG